MYGQLNSKLKFIFIGVIVLCILTFFSGCSRNNRQLSERLIVQGVGVDNQDDQYILTITVLETDVDSTSSEKEQGGSNTETISCNGRSILDAFSSIPSITGKQPMYSQNLVLVIGKEVAYNGVESFIDFFVRHYESRPSINLFVADGKAADVMNCKVSGKTISSKTISSLASTENLNMNVKNSNLVKFVSNLQSDFSSANAALLKINDEKILSAEGTAIFKKDKLVDFITKDETKGALLLDKQSSGGTEVIDIENIGRITYSIISSKCNTDINIVDDVPEFDIKIYVNANIYEIDNLSYDKITESNINEIENNLNERLKKVSTDVIKKCIMDNGCDIFNFGKQLLKKSPIYLKNNDMNWDKLMKISEYKVTVKTSIDKMGQQISR